MNNKDKEKSANVTVQIIISIIGLLGTIIATVIASIGFSPELVSLVSSPTQVVTAYPTFTPTSPLVVITPSLQAGLDPTPIKFSVLVVSDEFLQNNPSAVQNFLDQVEKILRRLNNPRIGLVLTTGYNTTILKGKALAEMANRTLVEANSGIFSESVMKSFSSIADETNPPGTIEIEIYFFTSEVP